MNWTDTDLGIVREEDDTGYVRELVYNSAEPGSYAWTAPTSTFEMPSAAITIDGFADFSITLIDPTLFGDGAMLVGDDSSGAYDVRVIWNNDDFVLA